MFSLSTWLKESLIQGVVKGEVSLAYVAVKTEDYLTRGVFTETDMGEIMERAIPPVEIVEEVIEEVVEA
jgi:hypothetical protein